RVAETTLKAAAVPLKVTAVAPVKLAPRIVTAVPTGPLVGLKELIVGAGGRITVKLLPLVAEPPGVVTLILPVVAPAGTVASMRVAETTVKAAVVPLKVTALAPVKPLPRTVTWVPAAPLKGLNEVSFGLGDAVTLKLVLLVPVPLGVVTAILPEVAPEGTAVSIRLAETTLNDAGLLLNV